MPPLAQNLLDQEALDVLESGSRVWRMTAHVRQIALERSGVLDYVGDSEVLRYLPLRRRG